MTTKIVGYSMNYSRNIKMIHITVDITADREYLYSKKGADKLDDIERAICDIIEKYFDYTQNIDRS